jgi:hypothetical protein
MTVLSLVRISGQLSQNFVLINLNRVTIFSLIFRLEIEYELLTNIK